MCGIVGFVNYNNKIETLKNELEQAVSTIKHRGPDSKDIHYEKNIGLGHTRLSIIDLDERSKQPMTIEHCTIIFNGEIYNYIELKKQLEALGTEFKTSSDTEVILQGYLNWGSDVFKMLNGIFSFALNNKESNKLYLVRDPLGIKPLYYYQSSQNIFFGSEIRSLLSFNEIPKKISKEGLTGYLKYGSFQEPFTPINNIVALSPGVYLEVELSKANIKSTLYQNIFEEGASNRLDKEKLLKLYDESIIRQSRSDVKTTIFLSGGIDSTAILALMKKNNIENISTTSIIFDEAEFSEDEYIKKTVDFYQVKHDPIKITEEDIIDDLDIFFDAMDSPSIDGFNNYMISKKVNEKGYKVAFSGTGGDELFVGYDDFQNVMKHQKYFNIIHKLPKFVKVAFYSTLHILPINKYFESLRLLFEKEEAYFKSRGIFSDSSIRKMLKKDVYNSWNENSTIDSSHTGKIKDSTYTKISYFEFNNYLKNTLLKDADQFSMAHSLELRVPLLDIELSKYVLSLKDKEKLIKDYPKGLITQNLEKLLPPDLRFRKKNGFTFPFEKWMKNHLGDKLEEYFYNNNTIFEKKQLEAIHNNYKKGHLNWARFWSIVVINRWMKQQGVTL
ncbi:MAG TPA: asparagine synthase (glutamine-hydrolyzing) [Sulfurimonas autotrophica]|nr:asparagine synthase (glutamine-hydrolyzing) [Sulfurimonas autotrophica]